MKVKVTPQNFLFTFENKRKRKQIVTPAVYKGQG